MYVAMTNICLLLDKLLTAAFTFYQYHQKIWFPYQITWFAKPLSHEVLDIEPAIYNDAHMKNKTCCIENFIYIQTAGFNDER